MLRVKLTLNLGLVYEKNRTLMENAEDLDIVMPMYNLFKCSDNYFMTLGSLQNYYRDEIDGVDHNSPRPPPPGNAGETD